MIISVGGEELDLRPSGAVRIGSNLIVADVHLGKERAFRQQGVPVPEGPAASALASLAAEVSAINAERLIFLGDLFHHEKAIAGSTFESLRVWLAERPELRAILVKGNHDRIPESLRGQIETVPSWSIGDLQLFHHPHDPEIPHLAGHLHPATTIRHGKQRERMRCFWLRQARVILPSYGEFTGCMEVSHAPGDQLFIAVGNEVRRINSR